ncbi:MAG: NAD(P)/FAD-dependent oxidoreductase, partial [Candidatus Helarchaeota archaeon]
METDYDLIIIGAGPAGLTAGIYAGRYGLKVAIFDKLTAGGQLALAPLIENYPGYKTIA